MTKPDGSAPSTKKSYKGKNPKWNGDAAQRSYNYAHQSNNHKAMERPNNNKKQNTPTEPYILQASQNLDLKMMVINPLATSNFSQWKELLAAEQIGLRGTIGGEVRGIPYVRKKPLPAEPELAGINADLKKIRTSVYLSDRAEHLKENIEITEARAQIISRAFALLSEPLRIKLVKLYPDYLNTPDVIAVMNSIEASFTLACYGGRDEDMAQQILQIFANFSSGIYAFENSVRNNGFDVHQHYKEAIKILELRKVAKLPDLAEDEQAKLLIYASETIDYLKFAVEDLKDNEYEFKQMPVITDAQQEKAREFRRMPLNLDKAYEFLSRIKDRGILYKHSKASNNLLNQSSTISKYEPKNDKKAKSKKTESKKSDNEKIVCGVCKGNHVTDKCFKLEKYAEVISKLEQESKPKKKAKTTTQSSTFTTVLDENDSDYAEFMYQKSSKVVCHKEILDIEDEFLTQYDNGCCNRSNEIKSKSLTWNRVKEEVNMSIQTTNGIRVLNTAEFAMCKAFGKVLYNPDAHLNLISQNWIEKHYPVKVFRRDNITLAYHVLLEPTDIVLKFKLTTNGIYIGSIKPLLQFPKSLSNPVPRFFLSNNVQDSIQVTVNQSSSINVDSTIDPVSFQNEDLTKVSSLALLKKKEDSADSTQYSSKEEKMFHFAKDVLQRNLGFMSPGSYATLVNTGGMINAPIPAYAMRKAFNVLGHNREYVVGRVKATKAKPHLAQYISSLKDGQILVEIDLFFLYELIFLLSVSYPGFYCVISYVGYGLGGKSSEHILPHLKYVFSVYKAMHKQIKFVSGDGEKGFAKLATEIQESAGTWLPLPRHAHPCFVDIKTKQIKEIMRCILASVKYDPPRKVLVGIVLTAVYFVNHTPCAGNTNKSSAMMQYLGVPLDAKKHLLIGPLSHVEVKKEDPISRNTMAERTIQAIALNPRNGDGWNCYNILTGKIISTTDPIPRPPSREVELKLQRTREEELRLLQTNKNTSHVTAVQAKNVVDFRTRHFPYNVKKYGLLNVAVAMRKEFEGLIIDKEVFTAVHENTLTAEDFKKKLTTGPLFSIKHDELKNRFITKGHRQDKSEFDYFEDIQSPTVQQTTVNQLIVTAAQKGLAIVTVDFNQAFGHAPQERLQYAIIDKWMSAFLVILWPERFKEFLRKDGTILVKLNKALYGQVDAARLFNKWLRDKLLEMDWVQNPIDQGLFRNDIEQLDPDIYAVKELATHVDDLFAIMLPSAVKGYTEHLKQHFPNVVLKIDSNIDEHCNLNSEKELEFLGMQIKINYKEHYGSVNPRKFYNKICLDYADLIKGKTKKVPAKPDFFTVNESPLLVGDIKERITKAIHRVRYPCSIAGETTLYASFFISRIAVGLTNQDLEKFIYFLQYINGRQNLPTNIGTNKNNQIEYSIWSDASLGIPSKTAGVFSLGRGPILMNHSNQTIVSIASAHSELYAASNNMTHAIALQNIMESRGVEEHVYRPGTFYVDNMAVIHMLKNGRSINSKSKHIHIRYFFMKQNFENGDFKLVHCPTDLMVADILTKPLQGEKFLKLRAKLLGHEYMLD